MNTLVRLSVVALVCLVASPGVLPAQTTATAPAAEEPVTFEQVDTPVVIKLTAPDPFLQEAKYAACFRVRAPGLVPVVTGYAPDARGLLAAMVQETPASDLPSKEARSFLSTQGGRAIRLWLAPVSPQAEPSAGPGERTRPPRPPYEEYEEESPYEPGPRSPYEEYEAERLYEPGPRPQPMGPSPTELLEVQVVAPSPEKAEEWARALITVYDKGWVVSRRRATQNHLNRQKAALQELLPQMEQAQAQAKEAEHAISSYSHIDEEAQAALRTKKWLLAVDVAGVEARAKQIDELLAEKHPAAQTGPELVKLQIEASVDLADLRARLEMSDELLAEAAKRAELEPDLRKKQNRAGALLSQKTQLESNIQGLERMLSTPNLPMRIEGNRVTIQPVQWEIRPEPVRPDDRGGRPFWPGE